MCGDGGPSLAKVFWCIEQFTVDLNQCSNERVLDGCILHAITSGVIEVVNNITNRRDNDRTRNVA